MTWYPFGPYFVFGPRDGNFLRLSRRNEVGRQSLISSITLDPTNPANMYVVTRPSSGGLASFRTRDSAETWTPLTDTLQRTDQADPTTFAVNPGHQQIVYLGTGYKGWVYTSNDYGTTWSTQSYVGGYIRRLIVDPRTTANPATTVILAVTDHGLFRSTDGGQSWTQTLAGDVWSLACDMPTSGGENYYAGVTRSGVYHATSQTGPWTNLNGTGIGLPAYSTTPPAENFTGILVGLCPRNPTRVYALTVGVDANGNVVTTGLFTTASATTSWSSIAMTSPPQPAYGYYDLAFAVAPNSPGDGANDILFFGNKDVIRSKDSGRTWAGAAGGFHVDVHVFEFFPSWQSSIWQSSAAGSTVPVTYVGCDGGLAASDGIADPGVDIGAAPPDWDDGLWYTDTWAWQNYNHGMPSVACYQFASDPGIPALGYLACQDTGLAAGTGGGVWRTLFDSDHNSCAAARGDDSMHVWTNSGWWNDWSLFLITYFKDTGDYGAAWGFATLGAGGSTMQGNSPFVVDTASWPPAAAAGSALTGFSFPSDNTEHVFYLSADGPVHEFWLQAGTGAWNHDGLTAPAAGNCLAGVSVRDGNRQSNTAITPGPATVTPTTMSGIVIGTSIEVDPGVTGDEMVTVTGVTSTTFTAMFANPHSLGAVLRLQRSVVARIDGDGLGIQISQDFGQDGRVVSRITPSPTDTNTLYCATTDGRLWVTHSAVGASSSTVWTEISSGRPAGIDISSLVVDAAGNLFILLSSPVTSGAVTTPLFQLSGGTAWTPIACTGVPGGQMGKLVCDPISPGSLYASVFGSVYQLSPGEMGYTWTDITENLPGSAVYDLWCGNVGSTTSPVVLLRAAIPTRGVFERAVASPVAPIGLYVRDNMADQGWTNPSPDGVPNPFDPANPGATLYHYMCADIRIDAQHPAAAGTPAFYQTDPEASRLPISPVRQETLKDNSSNLPQSDTAMVHVQVHNRSLTAANSVQVWAIFASAGAGLPSLSESATSGNAFPFWSQFTAAGQIVPNLPVDSPWQSVGPPQVLSGIDASNPRVASWEWTIPTLPSGDPGHYCMAVFVHSAASPVTETRMDLDVITPVNPQIGQKNLHIGAPLPPTPAPGPVGGGGGGGGGWFGDPGGHRPRPVFEEYVEFHNATDQTRTADLSIDMRGLPKPLRAAFRMSNVVTASPLDQAITGISGSHEFRPSGPGLGCLVGLIAAILCRLANMIRALLGRPPAPCPSTGDRYPSFGKTVYEAEPSALVRIQGIQLRPYGSGGLLLRMYNSGDLEPGRDHVFQVRQEVAGAIAGGSVYVIRIEGNRELPELGEAEDIDMPLDEMTRRLVESRHLPHFIDVNVKAREADLQRNFRW